MPHKLTRIRRLRDELPPARRPVMVAVAGDSAAGKTTLTRGLAEILGPERVTTIGVDDYHRYDRRERKGLPFTALHPECNHIEIMEQHLQLVATGNPILKPVYDHGTGLLCRPELVEPREFAIVEGLLPLHTRLTRACFDIAIYLDPPEPVRHRWKVERDTQRRGYTAEQVRAELKRREPESAEFIRPQRSFADLIVRFSPVGGDPPGTPLSADLVLRPTIPHPDLSAVLADDGRAIQLRLTRDEDGRPVDTLRIHGNVPAEESRMVRKAIWSRLGVDAGDPPETLGGLGGDMHSEPLAITQLLLLYHLVTAAR
ncbi:phosphoribulokinase [Actinoallomurus sp. NPDC050550]|uniref:phosphoribulokinase n=1 Tax=Actinoallomurus sp. NPDC050550 TaxID=3154937 RepID=UPI0033E66E1A